MSASETICSVSTSFATYPCDMAVSKWTGRRKEETYLVVDAAFEEARPGKVARTTSDEGDVDRAAEDGELCRAYELL